MSIILNAQKKTNSSQVQVDIQIYKRPPFLPNNIELSVPKGGD